MKYPFIIKKLIEDNAPTILSSAAIIGTAATGYLAARGGYKAAKKLQQPQLPKGAEYAIEGEFLSWPKKTQLVALEFAPAVIAGGATVTCIFFSHKISASRIVAMTAAYSLSENRLKEYRAKIEEKFGIEKKDEIEGELIHERLRSTPMPAVVFGGNDDYLCFDTYSGRYFKSNREDIRRAVNDTNFEVVNQNYATLNFFWDLIGLPPTVDSEEMGWNETCPLHIRFTASLNGDGEPALAINYDVTNVRPFQFDH